MRTLIGLGGLAVAVGLYASSALAGNIIVKVYDETNTEITAMAQTLTAGSNVTVTFSTAVNKTRTIRIYDSVTLGSGSNPAASMGTLTINGSATSAGKLNVLIADGDQGFPTNLAQADALRPGVVDFGGAIPSSLTSSNYGDPSHDYDAVPFPTGGTNTLPSGSSFPGWTDTSLRGLIIPDPTLRRQAVIAIVVLHDVCTGGVNGQEVSGRIEAGQILRVDARGETSSGVITGGNINAHIVASGIDNFLTYSLCNPTSPSSALATGFRAIETVKATNAIRGKITAAGRARDDTPNPNWGTGLQSSLYERDPTAPLETPPCTGINPLAYPDWINRGSIGNVVIVPSSATPPSGEETITRVGIAEDIEAKLGRIYSVRTWGPIGKRDSSGNLLQSKIFAADGIFEVRAEPFADVAYNASEAVKDFNCTIQTGDTSFDPNSLLLQFPAGDPLATGNVHGVYTNGFVGPVKCMNMTYDGGYKDRLGRCGVIARMGSGVNGSVTSTGDAIEVLAVAHNVSIIGHSWGLIGIGHHFKGAIIAHGYATDGDTVDGGIRPSELVGLGAPSGDAKGIIAVLNIGHREYSPETEPNITYYERGFIGGFGAPVDLRPTPFRTGTDEEDLTPTPTDLRGVPVSGVYPKMAWDPDRWQYMKPSASADEGAIDSVIHVETQILKPSFIYRMTQRILSEKEYIATYKPRLECPFMDYFDIGYDEVVGHLPVQGGLIDGVIWSGVLEYTSGAVDNYSSLQRRRNDYAFVKKLRIARVGPEADVWLTASDASVGSIGIPYIFEDMCGEFRMRYLAPGAPMEIGGKLGDASDFPEEYHAHAGTEASPRGLAAVGMNGSTTLYESNSNPQGMIQIAGDDTYTLGTEINIPIRRLEGPIVVNAKWQPGSTPNQVAFWHGTVVEGDLWGDANRLPAWLASPLNVPSGWIIMGPSALVPTAFLPYDTAPFYNRLSNSLRYLAASDTLNYGGSVGVAPFQVHHADSLPLLGNDLHTAGYVMVPDWFARFSYDSILGRPKFNGTLNPNLWARFYGPVEPRSSTLPNVVFERWTGAAWANANAVMHEEFYYDVTYGGYQRDILPGPYCDTDYINYLGLYRMRQPAPSDDDEGTSTYFGRVMCNITYPDQTDFPHPPADDFVFYFNIICNRADIGSQGGVDVPDGILDNNDFVVFINRFFGMDPRADIGKQGGVEGSDGLWDNNDFIIFINWFFAGGCASSYTVTCGEGFAGRPAPGGESGEDAAPPAMTREDVIEMFRQAAESMPPGERRTALEQLIQQLEATP